MSIFEDKYYLESTGDRTDRSAEIEAKLKEHGSCLLGTGVFYVSGVKMPDSTTLMGMGTATTVILLPEVEEGAAVQIGSFCSVKDLFLRGAEEDIELGDGVGERHGLLFKGTATTKDWSGQPMHSMVSSCHLASFTGGGITCTDTGYSARCAMTVTNCHAYNCGAGINISHLSEFHEFTNVLCIANNYGCVNNGGNNIFVNCGFTGNKTGFLIDNTDKKSPNNSHGSMVGCTINHSGKNEGVGIMVLGATSGYVFSACQIFFSKIVVENSSAIHFDNLNCGRKVHVTVKGSMPVLFTNSLFLEQVPLELGEGAKARFINCFTRGGTPVGVEKQEE